MPKEYDLYYRLKGNKNNTIFCCTVTCNNKREAKQNFNQFDNIENNYTIVKIDRV